MDSNPLELPLAETWKAASSVLDRAGAELITATSSPIRGGACARARRVLSVDWGPGPRKFPRRFFQREEASTHKASRPFRSEQHARRADHSRRVCATPASLSRAGPRYRLNC